MVTKLMVDYWPRMHKPLDCNPSTKKGEGDPQKPRNARPPPGALWDAGRMSSSAVPLQLLRGVVVIIVLVLLLLLLLLWDKNNHIFRIIPQKTSLLSSYQTARTGPRRLIAGSGYKAERESQKWGCRDLWDQQFAS